MNIDSLLLNLIIILFPLLINILHKLYINNSNRKESDLFLDIALISSFYLSITLNTNINYFFMLNIIFLLSLLKKRTFTSIIIFIFTIINYKYNDNIMLVQYIMSFILYIIYCNNKKKNIFVTLFLIINILFIFISDIYYSGFNVVNILSNILISIIFSLMTYMVLYIVNISEDIVRMHMNIKELEQEKQIRNSLFKITHEIKNPIAVCKSYLDMFDFNNKDHEKYIPILKEEIENVLILLQDFSCMSKIKIKNEILDINLLLEDIKRQLKPVLYDENIEFITNFSEEEFYIEGDYNRLSQVLTNIIKNAKEAKDDTKKSFINLETKIVKNNFIITIEDNGIGISKDELKKIKEPFYTTKKNGSGLGIALSSEIIKAHNGKLEFDSEEGKGTKVTIILPFKRIEF